MFLFDLRNSKIKLVCYMCVRKKIATLLGLKMFLFGIVAIYITGIVAINMTVYVNYLYDKEQCN